MIVKTFEFTVSYEESAFVGIEFDPNVDMEYQLYLLCREHLNKCGFLLRAVNEKKDF